MTNVHALPVVDQGPPTAHLTPGQVDQFERYLGMCYQGNSKVRAARACGIGDHNIMRWIDESEADAFVIARRRQLAASIAPAKVWTRLDSMLALRSIANDEFISPKARITAIQELNAMQGFTVPEAPEKNTRNSSAKELLKQITGKATPK
jgi:hypothetical protein